MSEYGKSLFMNGDFAGFYGFKEGECGYPRVCAHRGFKTVAPENSLPAFAAAVALGAPEIEMDIRFTADGVPVVAHDSNLERVSNGSGTIEANTLAELRELDFGGNFSERFAGVKIATFEEVLERFSRKVIINLHLKSAEAKGDIYPREQMVKVVELLKKYQQQEHVYFMGAPDVMERAIEVAPEIPRCMGAFPEPWEIVDRAIKYKCTKVQLFIPYYNQEMIDKAHAHSIKCNFFYCDDPAEAVKLVQMGVDTILTNDYFPVAQAIAKLR